MIANAQELQVALDRIRSFQDQVVFLRETDPDPENYRAAASGFLAEIERMQLEVRQFLSSHPAEAVHP
jgi:hypothetical protein